MRYGSVCSGIEAATTAWHDLGWKPSFFSEIEGFPRAVLKHHYPDTPLHGDFTTIKGTEYEPIDLLVGGTPCQSFSIAGLRGGLADDRGNLALEFLRLADRTRPRWLVWENVPGVLSSNGGRDFGSILGGMVELGYGIAYRILDAQYFGVAQRRRRVFVVGYLGDWRRAAAVLFERYSLQGHPPPRREKGQRIADSLTVGANQCSGRPGDFTEALNHWDGDQYPHPTLNQSHNSGGVGQSNQELFSQRGAYLTGDVSHTLNAGRMARRDYETETFIAFHSEAQADQLPSVSRDTSISDSLTTSQHAAVAFGGDVARTLSARYDSSPCADRGMDVVANQMKVRRLTPRECERLQGFPDDYTAIPWRGKPPSDCPDGPRYKALGNSMAVPVMRWIGQRIQMVENI
jgi:DNA (cytosine-5)-methyltransferase 1